MILIKFLPLMLCLSIIQTVYADDPLSPDPDKPLGDVSPIEVVVSQLEKNHDKKVLLPQYIPFNPTHSGGDYNETSKQVKLEYLNIKTNELLSIHVHFNNNERMKHEENAKAVHLDDNTDALYIHEKTLSFDFITFKKEGLTYLIAISKNDEKEKLMELMKVANSLK